METKKDYSGRGVILEILNKQRNVLTEFKNNTKTELLKENKGISINNDSEFGENELDNEKNSLISAINSDVLFGENPIIVYPEDNNVIMSGTIPDLNNLRFQFSFADSAGGCYISVNELVLNEVNIKKVNQLYNYFLNWKDEWLKKLPSYIKQNK